MARKINYMKTKFKPCLLNVYSDTVTDRRTVRIPLGHPAMNPGGPSEDPPPVPIKSKPRFYSESSCDIAEYIKSDHILNVKTRIH